MVDEKNILKNISQQSGTDTGAIEQKTLKDTSNGVDYADIESGNFIAPTWSKDAYQAAIDQAKNAYVNQTPFSYDVNSDALYQQYKNQYLTNGKLAMLDTTAQASAMTGGYGNSYATTAGNQAYQNYVSQLNDVVPDLYSLAYSKYNDETSKLYNNYQMAQNDYDNAYTEYQNNYTKKWNEYQQKVSEDQYATELALGLVSDNSSSNSSSSGGTTGTSLDDVLSGSSYTKDQLLTKAEAFMSKYPNTTLDDTTLENYLAIEGITGDAATYFKKFLYSQYGVNVYSGVSASDAKAIAKAAADANYVYPVPTPTPGGN